MNKAPLMIDYYNIGHIECKSVRWEINSIYPMLLIELSIAIRPYGEKNLPVTLFDMDGEVILEDGRIIGRANPIGGQLLFPSGIKGLMEYSASLGIDLDPDRAALMENYRKQGKSKLKINLNIVAYIKGEFGKGNTTLIVEIPEGRREKVEMFPATIFDEEQEVFTGNLFEQYSLKNRMAQLTAIAEKKLILEVLNKTNWNRRKAAELLGISYRSLLYKMKEYKIAEKTSGIQHSNCLQKGIIQDVAKTTLNRVVPKRILFVDDEPLLLQIYSDTIYLLGNYEVITANDGKEALQLVSQEGERIDLVVTDCNHPGVGGIEMCEIIKNEYPNIPIIMITGYYSHVKDIVPKGIFYAIHPKPIRVKRLGEIIKAALLSKEKI